MLYFFEVWFSSRRTIGQLLERDSMDSLRRPDSYFSHSPKEVYSKSLEEELSFGSSPKKEPKRKARC